MYFKFIMFLCLFVSLLFEVKSQVSQRSDNQNTKQDFYLLQVIDCRNQLKESSFMADRELLFDYTAHKIPENLNDYILGQLQHFMTGPRGTIPVVIKIDWLELERKYSQFYLNTKLDFYIMESQIYYYEFTAGDYIEIEKFNSVNDTRFKKQVKNLMGKCYAEFLHRMHNNLGYHTQVKKDEIYRNSLLSDDLYQDFADNTVDGIYYTFNLLRDDICDTVSNFSDDTSSANKHLYHAKLFKFQNVNLDDVYCVRSGGNIYLRKGQLFYPIQKNDFNYYLRSFGFLRSNNKPDAMQEFLLTELAFNVSLLYGILGYVAIDLMNENKEKSKVFFFDHTIDLLTGNILLEKVVKEDNQISD